MMEIITFVLTPNDVVAVVISVQILYYTGNDGSRGHILYNLGPRKHAYNSIVTVREYDVIFAHAIKLYM